MLLASSVTANRTVITGFMSWHWSVRLSHVCERTLKRYIAQKQETPQHGNGNGTEVTPRSEKRD